MSPVWEDPRVARGLEAMLALRSERIADGARPLGWKVAFGAPAALAALRIEEPVVGFLTDRSLVEPGSTVTVGGWTRPVLEPEVAMRVGKDLGIAALAPAFELADLDRPLDDVEAILSANIFHRGVALGEFVPADSMEKTDARIVRDGREHARTSHPQELTGQVEWLVGHVADLLRSAGERLRPGDVVIAGSIVPAIPIEPGEHVLFELAPLGQVELRFA